MMLSASFLAFLALFIAYSIRNGARDRGIHIPSPDFPENKEDWPFLWSENEYVIGVGASYIFAANAVNDVLNETKSR